MLCFGLCARRARAARAETKTSIVESLRPTLYSTMDRHFQHLLVFVRSRARATATPLNYLSRVLDRCVVQPLALADKCAMLKMVISQEFIVFPIGFRWYIGFCPFGTLESSLWPDSEVPNGKKTTYQRRPIGKNGFLKHNRFKCCAFVNEHSIQAKHTLYDVWLF